MLTFPVSQSTFRRSFLAGAGEVEVHTDQNVWGLLADGNKPFQRSVDPIADLKFHIGAGQPLTLGGASTLKLNVSGSAESTQQIQVVWPDQTAGVAGACDLQPGANDLLMHLTLRGKADAAGEGSLPVGPLSASFGVKAGAEMSYERWKIYPQAQAARATLVDLMAGIRLPQQVNAVEEIPAPGEVLVSRFGGYLKLSGTVSYGYSMTGSENVEIGKLGLDLDYKLRLLAGLTAAYQIAGDFEIEARAGSTPGFARFVARKSRESSLNLVADIGFDSAVHLQGLPDTADEFLVKAFGVHAERVLKLFGKAQTYTNVDELEKATGKLAQGAVHDLCLKLTGQALTNATLNDFVGKALRLVDAYNNVDSRIVHLYEDYIGRVPQLTLALNTLAGATTRDGLKQITDSTIWGLIERLAGDKLYDVLMEEPEFGKFAGLIQKARDFVTGDKSQQIRELIGIAKNACPLNDLLEQLRGVNTPEALGGLADAKLQGLVERLLGAAFEEIRRSNLNDALRQLHAAIDKVADFKTKYYEKLKELTNRSYQAKLTASYSRATTRDALVDVEVDVRVEEGKRLARLAGSGNFAELFNRYRSPLVRINKGVFSHSLASSTQIQINLFGYDIGSMSRLLQKTDEALEVHDGGLLHVYTTRTSLEEKRSRRGELTASTFLLATVANAAQPSGDGSREYLIRTLPKMSVQYDLLEQDDRTSFDEMAQILELGELLGIVKDRAAFVAQLRSDFPNGLGKVSVRYVIRYTDQDVQSAFKPGSAELERLAREAIRSFVSACYVRLRQQDWSARLGFAYRDPAVYAAYRANPVNFVNTEVRDLRPAQKLVLRTLYRVEEDYLKGLVDLDKVVDDLREQRAGVSIAKLNDVTRHFVQTADDVGFGRANAFFVVFDRLVMAGSGGTANRDSMVMIEVTPPAGEKVTKLLSAAQAGAEEPAQVGAATGGR